MSDEIKQRIGDYEVLGVLGSGGMGRVYKVRNVISDRVEAMKILLPNLAGRQELADRFLNEIKLLASLDHPNIAALRTALTVDNQLLMIMEYVEGTTLAARLEHGPIPVGETLDYINQVLAALSYAHARGVIHRDIKPGNMMLTPNGVVKLMDFGIARSGKDGGMTKTGTTLGSVHYMSPEQVRCEPIDARSDLYSLGITLYELVTGQRPFQADSEFSLMAAQVKEIPKPPVQLQAGLPAGLNEIILMAIQKDPVRRFQSAEAFRNALSNVECDSSGQTATMDIRPGYVAPAVAGIASAPAAAKVTPTVAKPPSPSGTSASGASAAAPQMPGSTAVVPRVATGVGVAAGAATEANAAATSAANVPPRKSDHHVLYITLGAVLALAALVGAGTYVSARRGRANQGGSMLPPSPNSAPASAAAPSPAQTPSAPAQTDQNAGGTEQPAPAASSSDSKPGGASPATSSPASGKSSAAAAAKDAAAQAAQQAANDQAAAASAAAAAEKEKLDQLEMSIDQLQSRIDSANNSLQGIEQEQSRSGMRMRSDITAARSAMLNSLKKAQDAVADHDAEKAKRYSDQAEANLEIVEHFLGRR